MQIRFPITNAEHFANHAIPVAQLIELRQYRSTFPENRAKSCHRCWSKLAGCFNHIRHRISLWRDTSMRKQLYFQ
ncbi:hypothetical protein [Polaromonas glacialis]|uniref:hypothetical protein n=1 Tax=Polaromonas glacialis TaxID=866564 RepID=UPI0012EC8796|nr:hypothetical protein [Polaromonas glacialis]